MVIFLIVRKKGISIRLNNMITKFYQAVIGLSMLVRVCYAENIAQWLENQHKYESWTSAAGGQYYEIH